MRILRLLVVLFVISSFVGLAYLAPGQQSAHENDRKILKRIDPLYPEMAKRMRLEGTVKVFAVVAMDGSVKTVEPVGGNPLLIQASADAIKGWKFAPASSESKELIELHFRP